MPEPAEAYPWPYKGYFETRAEALDWFAQSGAEKMILASIDGAADLGKHVNLIVLPVQEIVPPNWAVVTRADLKKSALQTVKCTEHPLDPDWERLVTRAADKIKDLMIHKCSTGHLLSNRGGKN